jgi:hypothetical protein
MDFIFLRIGMSENVVLEMLQDKSLDIQKVAQIYKEYKNNKNIESCIAMNLSLRTSVYDKELEKSSTMISLLEQLAFSDSMEARWAVAKNPHTPMDTLIYLAKDSVNLVRALVATNANTPSKILEQFFHDEKIVRDGLSGNENTPLKILTILAKDTDKMVRLRVTNNASVSNALLEQLCNDEDANVQLSAKKKLASKKEENK